MTVEQAISDIERIIRELAASGTRMESAILQYAQPEDENIMDQEVRLDIDLAKRILEYASDYTDEGPIDEGWQSSQVARDVAALERAIGVASDASKGKAEIPK